MPDRLPHRGKDERGVPLLHDKDSERHFERLAVFLAYRNVFRDQKYSGDVGRFVKRKVTPAQYAKYHYLIPNTQLKRLLQVLATLFALRAFEPDSLVRQAFADITDEQIRNRDPAILHRLPLTAETFAEITTHKTTAAAAKMPSADNFTGVENPQRTTNTEHVETQVKDTTKTDSAYPTNEIVQGTKRLRDEGHLMSETATREKSSISLPLLPIQSSAQRIERLESHHGPRVFTGLPESPTTRPNKRRMIEPPGLDRSQDQTPFNIRHLILTTTQHLLEEACFYFAQKWFPARLHKLGWVTPEQGELNRWWGIIQGCQVPAEAVDFGALDVRYLFHEAAQLRHAAVHRLNEASRSLEYFLRNASLVLQGLRDYPRGQKLRRLQDTLRVKDWTELQQVVAEPVQQGPVEPHFYNPLNFQGTGSQPLRSWRPQCRLGESSMTAAQNGIPLQALRTLSGNAFQNRDVQKKVESDPDCTIISSRPVPVVIDLTGD